MIETWLSSSLGEHATPSGKLALKKSSNNIVCVYIYRLYVYSYAHLQIVIFIREEMIHQLDILDNLGYPWYPSPSQPRPATECTSDMLIP